DLGCDVVYAIDPADLSEAVLKNDAVRHLKMKLQEALPLLLEELCDGTDDGAAVVRPPPVSIWVCDVNARDESFVVDTLLQARDSGLVGPGTMFVLTVKCAHGHSAETFDLLVQEQVDRLLLLRENGTDDAGNDHDYIRCGGGFDGIQVLHFSSELGVAAAVVETETVPAAACSEEVVEMCNLFGWVDNNGYYAWVLAGRYYAKGETIGFPHDTVLNFTLQSGRGFVVWSRSNHHHFHVHHDGKTKTTRRTHLTYAPGLEWPFECHDRLFNARVNRSTYHITSDRAIAPLDPIILECWQGDDDDDFFVVMPNNNMQIDDFPQIDRATLQQYGRCLDNVDVRSDDDNDGGGVFVKRSIEKGDVIATGKMVHMHRTELYNETTRQYQELVRYTYGHPKSDLLLLPNFPVISSIRHGRPANVKLVWDNDDNKPIEEILRYTTDIQFGQHETSYLWAAVVAMRRLSPGEELLLDFGDAFEEEKNPKTTSTTVVLQERSVPDGFFPDSWLRRETRTLASDMPEFALPKLEPGQHRVGFPPSVADTMQEWAEEIGLMDHLKRYVFDKPLDVGTSERVRFNNGTWWTRRFGHQWASNMHYITTDDDESNEQMFRALARGGFDKVLAGIGKHFNWTQVTCFYPSYIVVNHCVKSNVHSDSDLPNVKNLIFPVLQVPGNSDPELILAEDDSFSTYVPYKYEREHGILLGKDGMHGTAPTDYRDDTGGGGVRVVVSVYMADFSKDDEDLEQFIKDWVQDPPYPKYYRGQLRHALTKRIHWHRDDPSLSIGDPMP
ncbi:MAG: hypothetical protein SGILL_009141, partial [Bacillariaceae sp.]